MLVKEIMISPVISVKPIDTVYTACLKYRDSKIGCLVISENGICKGIVTERDLIERTICEKKNPHTTLIEEIMSPDIVTINVLDTIEHALQVMKQHNIKKLPVVSKNKIVGIVTVTDISRARPELSQRFMQSWVKPIWKD